MAHIRLIKKKLGITGEGLRCVASAWLTFECGDGEGQIIRSRATRRRLFQAEARKTGLPVTPGGGNLFFQLVARYEGAMILTSNRGFAEWGDIFGDTVVATALLDRLLHHAVVIQIEGSSYRLCEHADLLPENVRFKPNAAANPIPPTLKRCGRPPKTEEPITPTADRQPARLGNFPARLLRKIGRH